MTISFLENRIIDTIFDRLSVSYNILTGFRKIRYSIYWIQFQSWTHFIIPSTNSRLCWIYKIIYLYFCLDFVSGVGADGMNAIILTFSLCRVYVGVSNTSNQRCIIPPFLYVCMCWVTIRVQSQWSVSRQNSLVYFVQKQNISICP